MKTAHESTAVSGKVLKRLIVGLIVAARRDVTRLGDHEAVATHQLRVRMKKILALLRLARECVPDRTFEAMRMHLRAVKNACAGNRDRVVRDKLVEKLSRRFHLAPCHRIDKGARVSKPPASYLRHQLCALEQLVETTNMESLSADQVVAAHALTYRRGRRLMKAAFEAPEEGTLHRWRHRVKDIHYQTLALYYLPGAARRVRQARKLGGILGRERDLASLARERAYITKRGPWSHLIQEHRSKLRERSLVLGHKVYQCGVENYRNRIERRLQAA